MSNVKNAVQPIFVLSTLGRSNSILELEKPMPWDEVVPILNRLVGEDVSKMGVTAIDRDKSPFIVITKGKNPTIIDPAKVAMISLNPVKVKSRAGWIPGDYRSMYDYVKAHKDQFHSICDGYNTASKSRLEEMCRELDAVKAEAPDTTSEDSNIANALNNIAQGQEAMMNMMARMAAAFGGGEPEQPVAQEEAEPAIEVPPLAAYPDDHTVYATVEQLNDLVQEEKASLLATINSLISSVKADFAAQFENYRNSHKETHRLLHQRILEIEDALNMRREEFADEYVPILEAKLGNMKKILLSVAADTE